ncbi:hypothetical protein, partial [Candidatus Venteria ishoeyi]|uniref:hypothetical protein n=1 Tax=Candidatus Venteria ishoeyi TaxID=1899563 RepID=UPI0011B0BC60
MKQEFKDILLNNWTISLVLILPIIFFLNPVKEKFTIKKIRNETTGIPIQIFYNDLNGDGYSERIDYFKNRAGKVSVKVFDPSNKGQSNALNNYLLKTSSINFADVDNNGINEIYYLGIREDSIFVNVVDYSKLNSSGLLPNPTEYFLIETSNESDYGCSVLDFYDLDNDSHAELLFLINSGYSLQPRKLISLNLKTGKLNHSPLSGIKNGIDFIEDIDMDGKVEIVKGSYAFRNYENIDDIPYTDTCSWIMVYKNDLTFKFDPILTSKEKTDTKCYPIYRNDSVYILSLILTVNKLNKPLKYIVTNPKGLPIKTGTFIHEEKLLKARIPIGIN